MSERDAAIVVRLEGLIWSEQSQVLRIPQSVWSKMAEELPPLLTVRREATKVSSAMVGIDKKSCGLCATRGPQELDREN